MWIVLFVVLMDIVGIGIVSPIFPYYALSLGFDSDVAMLCMALYTAGLFISTPIMGRLSDKYGRKPIIAASMLGSVAGYLMLAFANDIWMVALSRIVGGVMAGNFSAAQAYITDKTDELTRGKFMGLFGATMGLGFVFGPVIGSWLGGDSFQNADLVTPAVAAATLSMLGFFAVVFFLEESAPLKAGEMAELRPIKFNLSIRAAIANNVVSADGASLLVKAILCSALYQVASGFYENIFPVWAGHFQVADGPRELMPMFLISGLSYVFVQAFVIKRLSRPGQERGLLILAGILLLAASYLITIAADYSSRVVVTVLMAVLASCAGMIFTSAQTVVSFCAKPESRGLVMGTSSSIGMLGKTLAVAFSGLIYTQFSPHAPYYFAGITAVVLLAIAISMPRNKVDDQPQGDLVGSS